jgi:hypothetical protein
MQNVLDLGYLVACNIQDFQSQLQARHAQLIRQVFNTALERLTFFSSPSILSMPLWLRYISWRSANSSRPSSLVMRFDWIDRILSFFKPCRFYTIGSGFDKGRESLAAGTSSLAILFFPSQSSSKLARESKLSIFYDLEDMRLA